MTGQPAPRPSMRFGEFAFTPGLRRLERSGVVVELSSRAVDILAVLTERPGEVIAKRELLARVWPDVVVVEAALRFHMVALRRALGDGEAGARFITTVPGRGYCFVGSLESAPAVAEGGAAEGGAPLPRDAPRPLPAHPAKVVGRDEVVEDLLRQLQLQRFVTVVGPGGIGKTTVALMAAHQWEGAHRGATVFVDLGDLDPENPESVAEALCATLGVVPQGLSALERVLDHLRTSQALVVLDTCEGIIDAAARLAESLVASAPGVRVLATSREALRAEGELVYRIEPLAVPAGGIQLTAQEALTYPAVQLFVQRVAANHAGFELSDADASIVAAICRELDGMALAIELAAGRVEAFGVQHVADLLTTEFALTWPGRRTAVPRQQTLNATLNWSHELLGAAERKVFRQLSVFAGAFSLEAAMAACGDSHLPEAEVVEALFTLVSKSLVCTVTDGSRRRYRLLDIARAYARGKLDASGEEAAVRQRQARYYMESLNLPAAGNEERVETSEQVANVRAVLGWAFATEGMDALAIELSAAAASLWLREGLLADSRRWTREALARLDRGIKVGSELEARVALASSLMYTHGITAESHRNWEIIYQRTQFDGRSDLRLAGLGVVWGHQIRLAHFGAAQRLLDEASFLEAVNGDATVAAGFRWMAATTAHYRGDHRAARTHAARILDELTEAASGLMRRLFGYDLEVGALRLLSLSHFFLGDVDSALALRARALERATALSYVAPLANTLYWQAFMAYLLEETEEVDRLTTSIIESGKPNAMQPSVGWAIAVQGLSLVRRGEVARGKELVDRGMSICQEADYHMMDAFIRAEYALQLARQATEAQAERFFLGEPDEESWSSPEVLRIKGAIAELDGDLAGAEARYLDALAVAERQGALTWRLRAATSLAALWLSQGRAAEAQATLAPVYEQFSAGRQWPDLRRAADCLEECRRALAAVTGRQGEGLDQDDQIDGLLQQTRAPPRSDPPGVFDA
ncbi:MAG: transcriptional regulatory protein [Caulobacteraceae bacterium]|nr:transcriptional regulatory protein [Caulobacteraceae bacterium]